MEPMTMAAIGIVGINAAGAIANWLNSEEGRKAGKRERDRLEAMINKLQSPTLDTGVLTPPELRILETYVPQVADLILEEAPELVTVSARGEMGAAAQDQALQRFQQIAAGQDTQGQVDLVRALSAAAERSGSQRDAILADMSRQGVAPSSSAYAQLQYGLGNQTQRNMFMASLEAALADRNRRDRATGSAADLGGNIYGQEVSLEKYNDDIINSLNRRNTQARREWTQNRADLMNKASVWNMDRRQKYADTNLTNLYDAIKESRNLRNQESKLKSDFEMNKVNALAGVSNNRVQDIYANTADRSNLIKGLSDGATTAAMIYGMGNRNPNEVTQTSTDSYNIGDTEILAEGPPEPVYSDQGFRDGGYWRPYGRIPY